jgi:hypothetical protein
VLEEEHEKQAEEGCELVPEVLHEEQAFHLHRDEP